jgi:hypothetical protein
VVLLRSTWASNDELAIRQTPHKTRSPEATEHYTLPADRQLLHAACDDGTVAVAQQGFSASEKGGGRTFGPGNYPKWPILKDWKFGAKRTR